jgi:hypothetical protein
VFCPQHTMAVIYVVFSLREGDILNLEMATHSWDTASALVLSRIENPNKWYSIRRFPVPHSYESGVKIDVIVDVPDRDFANIRIIDIAESSENIFRLHGDDTWGDTIAVS